MSNILSVFDPVTKTWKDVPAIKGDTGKQGVQGSKGVDGKSPIVTASMNAKGELILDIR